MDEVRLLKMWTFAKNQQPATVWTGGLQLSVFWEPVRKRTKKTLDEAENKIRILRLLIIT